MFLEESNHQESEPYGKMHDMIAMLSKLLLPNKAIFILPPCLGLLLLPHGLGPQHALPLQQLLPAGLLCFYLKLSYSKI